MEKMILRAHHKSDHLVRNVFLVILFSGHIHILFFFVTINSSTNKAIRKITQFLPRMCIVWDITQCRASWSTIRSIGAHSIPITFNFIPTFWPKPIITTISSTKYNNVKITKFILDNIFWTFWVGEKLWV